MCTFCIALLIYLYCFCLSIDNRSGSKKWREMMENVEFFYMCMCIVFAFQLIRAKEVRIDIEVKKSEEKWREVMTCDVSPVAMFFLNAVPRAIIMKWVLFFPLSLDTLPPTAIAIKCNHFCKLFLLLGNWLKYKIKTAVSIDPNMHYFPACHNPVLALCFPQQQQGQQTKGK